MNRLEIDGDFCSLYKEKLETCKPNESYVMAASQGELLSFSIEKLNDPSHKLSSSEFKENSL
ncbi:hypothetical protein [Coxiella burnetii]|uniref:hypothetical protein n=1 Tax=Coxiella burnetii TaxID=777 RepID=UPI001F5B6628|nr:hypothetical protein [Coxiella burnetii]